MQNNKIPEGKLTTRTIVKLFKQVADCIDAIEQFSFGYEWQANEQMNLKYPHLFLETPQRFSITRTNKEMTIGFIVMDISPEDEYTQAVGDEALLGLAQRLDQTEVLIEKIIGMLNKGVAKSIRNDFVYDCVPLLEYGSDRTIGWRCDITFKGSGQVNYCDVPTNEDIDNCIDL